MKKTIAAAALLILMLGVSCAFADSDITVVSRENGSGTRSAFIELTGVEVKDKAGVKTDKTCKDSIVQNGTAQVIVAVTVDENAIGYISLGSLDTLGNAVKAVTVEGVEATAENVKNSAYAISRPFVIAVKAKLNDPAKDFIAWMLSTEGQQIVSNNHYVPLEPQAYAAAPVTGKVVIGGSSSVGPLMEKLAENYMKLNDCVEIEVKISDSATGMKGTVNGIYDIGMASRELTQSELNEGLTGTVIAMDGIAVIVNPNNTVSNLSTEQIRQIFTGETTNWTALQ